MKSCSIDVTIAMDSMNKSVCVLNYINCALKAKQCQPNDINIMLQNIK